MSDTTPTRRPRDADTTPDRDVVSATVAAQRLGITPDAVRARLRRGTIDGQRVDGDWQVFLPRDTTGDEAQHDTRHDADTTPAADRHDVDTTTKPDRTEELIVAQREEIVFLRDQLDHSRRELSTERERFDIIHREALSRIEALTAGLTTPVDEDDDELRTDSVHKSDEASQTADVAPGATEAASPSDESNARPSTAPRSVFGDWWAWVRGR